MDLETLYQQRCVTPWNINEHLPTLRRYASECRVVTEFGTHVGFSTIAFLAGQPEELHCYDIVRQPDVALIEEIAASQTKTKFTFHQQSSLTAEFDSTDLLFIDSLHQYDQVLQELCLHAPKVKQYLMFHDTFAWAYIDENPSGNPTDINFGWAHKKGVAAAIGHYMVDHPEWKIYEQFYHNCGLTVYKREVV